jgi:hypothetical protein
LVVLVGVQLFVLGLYLPPVFTSLGKATPPQTIISEPVQTAVWKFLASGALLVVVAIQLFVAGLYRPPVFKALLFHPPQMIMMVPLQTVV